MSHVQRPRHAWLLDAFAVAAYTFFIGVAIERLSHAFAPGWNLGLILLAAPLGYLLADFATGFAHWFCDTFFEENTFVVGPMLIRSFREHHRDPLSITRHAFLELNGNNCLAVTPVAASLLFIDPGAGDGWLFAYSLVLFLCIGTVATNQFHRWAHEPAPNRLARFLQTCRLILPPTHHSIHHVSPYARHYCVTNGWANHLMEAIGFWRIAERALIAVGVPKSAGENSEVAPSAAPDFAA